MKRFLVIPGLLVLGLLSGLALAACGGDSAPETPIVVTDTTQNLSKAEFISQADAVCEEGNTQIADIAAAGEGVTRAAEVAQIRTQMSTDIRDLGTPVDDGTSSSSSSSSSTSSSLDTGSTSTTSTHDTSTFPEGPSTTGGTDTGTSTGTGTGTETGTSAATGTGTSATATPVSGDPLETFLTALEAAATAGEKIDLANQRGESTVEGEAELTEAKDQASTAATEYGFEQCGTDGTSSGTSTSSSSDTVTPSAPVTPAPSAPSDGGSGSTDGTSGGGVSPGGGGVSPGQ